MTMVAFYATAITVFAVVLVLGRVLRVLRQARAAGVPSEFILFDPKFPLPLPSIRWVSKKRGWSFRARYSQFERSGSDVITMVLCIALHHLSHILTLERR
ncbi:hypothetical protein EXIGLDRAFT_398169 [Exidia glandulosa HHB12029]|uniref:Uncharacterized protein n=1 Tax=Exidia glandulosa HHB12029 TaxID=1314781 RepID=A0A165BMU9_EXIGL|nr:hypothetical protein EXIGLDRAFT_398169 [Exidia glandulosa HHB12029]